MNVKMLLPRFLWDQTSKEFFDPRDVETDPYNLPPDFQISNRDLVSLSGAPKGSKVSCSPSNETIGVFVENNKLFSELFYFTLFKRTDGLWRGHMHLVKIHPNFQRRGITTRMFISCARISPRLGIARFTSHGLHIDASESPTNEQWAGVHASLTLGWNSDLSSEQRQAMPTALRSATTLQDLLSLPGGKEWWNRNPSSLDLYFDTSPGSDCVRRLDVYTKAKGIRISQ